MDVSEPQRRATRRLAANLFLCPKYIHLFSEYWFREYTPLPIETGAGVVISDDFGVWMAGLLSRLLRPPRDFVLSGQGGMAVTVDAVRAGWLYTINFVPPEGDMSMAIPMMHISKAEGDALTRAIAAMHFDPERFWERGIHGGMHGELWFDNFLYMDELNAFYCASIYVLVCMQRFINALCHVIPPSVLHTEGYAILLKAILALNNPQLAQERENQLLVRYRQRLRDECVDDIYACRRVTDEYVSDLTEQIARAYRSLANELEFPFVKEEAQLLPWYAEKNKEGRIKASVWNKVENMTREELRDFIARSKRKRV